MVELEELQWRFMDGKVGHSPKRRRLGKNGEVEEFAGKREREEMVGQEEEIVGKGWLTFMAVGGGRSGRGKSGGSCRGCAAGEEDDQWG